MKNQAISVAHDNGIAQSLEPHAANVTATFRPNIGLDCIPIHAWEEQNTVTNTQGFVHKLDHIFFLLKDLLLYSSILASLLSAASCHFSISAVRMLIFFMISTTYKWGKQRALCKFSMCRHHVSVSDPYLPYPWTCQSSNEGQDIPFDAACSLLSSFRKWLPSYPYPFSRTWHGS